MFHGAYILHPVLEAGNRGDSLGVYIALWAAGGQTSKQGPEV